MFFSKIRSVLQERGPSSEPLVSVILTSYNHEKFVLKSLRSVLNQTCANIEVIVIDDGSFDRSVQKLQTVQDPRVRIIALEENRRFHPRNTALKIASGKYVAFQNSDDVWAKNKLEKQIAYLEGHPEVGAVFAKPTIINEEGKVTRKTWAEGLFSDQNRTQSQWLWDFFMTGNCLCVSSAVVRRPLLQQIGNFHEGLIQLADHEVWVKLAGITEFYVFSEPLVKMRIVGKKNVSAPSPEAKNRAVLELAQIYELYARPEILQQIAAFLPPLPSAEEESTDELLLQGRLLLHCWQHGNDSHQLFADGLASQLFRSPEKKERLLEHFGVDFMHRFVHAKSFLEIKRG